MSVILCTHHGGGLGKTTLAIHVAGVLAETLSRVLLIDCDGQRDSYHFFTGRRPDVAMEFARVHERLDVVLNRDRASIRKVARVDEYDYIVIDIDTPLPNTVQTIADAQPDLVLVPISRPNEHKGLEHLPEVLATFAELARTTGHSPRVVVVPLGAAHKPIADKLDASASRPSECSVAARAPILTDVDRCIQVDRCFIWDLPAPRARQQRAYFQRLVGME